MPVVTLTWLIGPLLLLCIVVFLSMRRASARRVTLDAARLRGRASEEGLAAAMSDALTRLRGQELAQQARHAALEEFLRQVVDGMPTGVLVLSPDGHVRLANGCAQRWLGLPDAAEGRVLWTLEGTDPLRQVAQACLEADSRRDALVTGPGEPATVVPVTAVPLRTPAGDVDGVLCVLHVERVA